MKKRARIVYNCFYPDFDDGYDKPIVARTLRSAKRHLLRWGWYGWYCGSIVRQIRHPLVNLAQARWILRDPEEFDFRVISRRRRRDSSPIDRTDRAHYARNMKYSRPEIVRQDALEAAKRKAELEAWELANSLPLGTFSSPPCNVVSNPKRQVSDFYEPDANEIPF